MKGLGLVNRDTMARARNLKPSLFKNELLGQADPTLTILFAGLWCLADRDGYLEDRPLRIKAEILPYRESLDINVCLTELYTLGFIRRFIGSNGEPLIHITKFLVHQNPHKTERESELVSFDNGGGCPVTVKYTLDNGSRPADPLLLIPDSLLPPTDTLNNKVADAPAAAVEKKTPRKRNKNFEIAAANLPPDVAEAFARCWRGWPTMGYNFKEKSNQPRRINQAKACENFYLVCQNLNLATVDGTPIGPAMIADAALSWVDRLRQKTFKQYGNDIAPPVPCIANFFSADPASKKHWQEAIVEQFGAEP